VEKTAAPALRVLILEDVLADAELEERELRKAGFACTVQRVETQEAFLTALHAFQPEIVLADYNLPQFSALAALTALQERHPEIPCIVVTGTLGDERAVEVLKHGATDYILKERLARLGPAVHRALADVEEHRKRKQTEEALRDSERRYARLFHDAPDPILMLDRLACIQAVNPAVEQACGYSAQELVGKHFSMVNVVAPVSLTKVAQEFAFVIMGSTRPPFELELIRKDGARRIFEAHSKLVADLGSEPFIQTIFRDVTERKRAEEELRRAYGSLRATQAQLAQAEKMSAIGQLASGIAHEVKNPLQIVVQGIDCLAAEVGQHHPEWAEDVRTIKDAVARTDRIIRGILNFARPAQLELKPTSLPRVIDASLDLIQKQLELKHIAISRTIDEALPELWLDENQIKQVFINLFLNAFQAMPAGGQLAIRVHRSGAGPDSAIASVADPAAAPQSGDAVVCELQDTGAGISPEALSKIFDPFFTTKPPGQGTGLGLTVTRAIMESHGGSIAITSQEGHGTTVTLTFPVARGAEHAHEDPAH